MTTPSPIRKTAISRTNLFLPTRAKIVREIQCMGGVSRYKGAQVFHVLPTLYSQSCSVACWHCAETIDNTSRGIPIPRLFDANENMYCVYGITCCPGCTKAYILEHSSFERGHTLNIMSRMLRDVFDHNDFVVPTPPRAALRRFGGPMEVPRMGWNKSHCQIVEGPFVSYCMIAEEHKRGGEEQQTFSQGTLPDVAMDTSSEDVEEKVSHSLFEDFVKTKQVQSASGGGTSSSCGSSVSKKRSSSAKTPRENANVGPMSKYVKKG